MNIKKTRLNSKLYLFVPIIIALVLLLSILTPIQSLASSTTAQVSAWYLLPGTKTNDWQARLDAQNKVSEGTWFGSAAVSAGNVIFTYTYTGRDGGPYGDGWQKNGMSESGLITWSNPSLSVIKPGEFFSMELTCSHLQSTFKYPQAGWSVLAQSFLLDDNGEQAGGAAYLTNDGGGHSFTSTPSNGYQTFVETVSGTAGSGTTGDRMTIRISAGGAGTNVETWYIYQWTEAGSSIPTSVTEEPKPSPSIMTEPFYITEEDFNADSGVMFAELYGEVNVKHWGEDDDAYEFAELDMVLHNGDIIRTKANSGAILSFEDLSTVEIGPNSIIVLDTAIRKESKIKLVCGTIIANIKKMFKDGTMDVEMSQAVLGTKGTTFVCAELDGISSVLVLEGTIEWRPTNGDTPILVNGGETVVTKGDYTSDIAEFSPAEELARWSETGQQMIIASLIEKGVVLPGVTDIESSAEAVTGAANEASQPQGNTISENTSTDTGFAYGGGGLTLGHILIIAAVVVVAGLVVIVLLKKRKPVPYQSQGYPHAPSYQQPTGQPVQKMPPRYCTNCGKPLSPDSKFCAECGKHLE